MIITYMKAENLKFRRSLFRKLILLIPAGLILMSVIFIFIGIGMGGFSSSVVCNWCMPVACLSVTILCHLANKKEQKHGYRTLYSLPVDLKKTFISKIILTALTLLIISLLLSFITVISECMFSGVRAALGRSGLYAADVYKRQQLPQPLPRKICILHRIRRTENTPPRRQKTNFNFLHTLSLPRTRA